MHFPSSNTCKSCGNYSLRGQSLPRHKITCQSPLCSACRPSATTVARTSKEIPACQNSFWWSTELAVPPKYCMKDTWPSWYQRCHLLHYLQDMVQLQTAHEKCRSSAGTWTCSCQGRVCRGINVVAWCKHWETERDRVHLCNVCDKDFKSLPTHKQQKIWQHIGHVFVCMGCGKKYHTKSSAYKHKKLLQLFGWQFRKIYNVYLFMSRY